MHDITYCPHCKSCSHVNVAVHGFENVGLEVTNGFGGINVLNLCLNCGTVYVGGYALQAIREYEEKHRRVGRMQ